MDPMKPIYLPKRQGDVSDEDYDTGIAMNEQNLAQNFGQLYKAVTALQTENQSLREMLASLKGGKA